MSIPNSIRDQLKERLWTLADEVGWLTLSAHEKARLYAAWTRDSSIGGVVASYMDARQARVYLKDTLLKAYSRTRMAEEARPLRVMGIPETAKVVETYIKPHGRCFDDGRVICWGRAEEWRHILLSLHERSFGLKGRKAYGAVIANAVGRFREKRVRDMIQDAANKLGIEKLIWLDV